MAKNRTDFSVQDEERVVRKFHNAKCKGRQKQRIESLIKRNWESVDDWDDVSIEMFQKFNKRSCR